MDAKLLQRVMDLAEKTGDRVIVVNPKTGNAHAILPFDAYEKMVDGSASLRNLGDGSIGDSDEDDDGLDLAPELPIAEIEDEHEPILARVITDEEPIRKAANIPLPPEIPKKEDAVPENTAELSEKEAGGLTSLDILDDEEGEEQYYLEPLE